MEMDFNFIPSYADDDVYEYIIEKNIKTYIAFKIKVCTETGVKCVAKYSPRQIMRYHTKFCNAIFEIVGMTNIEKIDD